MQKCFDLREQLLDRCVIGTVRRQYLSHRTQSRFGLIEIARRPLAVQATVLAEVAILTVEGHDRLSRGTTETIRRGKVGHGTAPNPVAHRIS